MYIHGHLANFHFRFNLIKFRVKFKRLLLLLLTTLIGLSSLLLLLFFFLLMVNYWGMIVQATPPPPHLKYWGMYNKLRSDELMLIPYLWHWQDINWCWVQCCLIPGGQVPGPPPPGSATAHNITVTVRFTSLECLRWTERWLKMSTVPSADDNILCNHSIHESSWFPLRTGRSARVEIV